MRLKLLLLSLCRDTRNFYTLSSENCSIPQEINPLIFIKYISPIVEGSNITLACPPGMVLNGPSTSSCLENGEWDPEFRESKCAGYY